MSMLIKAGDQVVITHDRYNPYHHSESYKSGERGIVEDTPEGSSVVVVRLEGDYSTVESVLPLLKRPVSHRVVNASILHLLVLQPPDNSILELKDSSELCALPNEDSNGEKVLKNIFAGMDVDSNNLVTVKELNAALRQSHELQQIFNVKYFSSKGKGKASAPPAPVFFENLIKKFDKDGDGKISYDEFTDYFLPKFDGRMDSVECWAALWKTFNEIDCDNNAKIRLEELSVALRDSSDIQKLFNFDYSKEPSNGKGEGAPPPPAALHRIIQEIDKDGDSQISWDEFVTHFRK